MVCKEVKVTRIMDNGEVRVYTAKRWFSTDEEKEIVRRNQKNKAYRLLNEDIEDREELNKLYRLEAFSLFDDDFSVIEESFKDYVETLKF